VYAIRFLLWPFRRPRLEKAREDARTHIFIHKYLLCMPTSKRAEQLRKFPRAQRKQDGRMGADTSTSFILSLRA
jgi:hypothetical protein